MTSPNDKKNVELYKELLNKHGNNFKSLNWGSKESQELRFKVLLECTDINNKTLLDVGCGLCDLYNYLADNNFEEIKYTGIDITDDMVKLSKKRFPSIEIINTDIRNIEKSFDCIFASGIFTYQSKEFLESFITSAFGKTNDVLSFNSLSAWSETKDEGEFYADPLETISFCRTITPWVTMRHDYHSRDFTIYMYKSRNI